MDKWKVGEEGWEGDGHPGVNIDIGDGCYFLTSFGEDVPGCPVDHPFEENWEYARLIVACVNAVRAVAERIGVEPLEVAQAMEDGPPSTAWEHIVLDIKRAIVRTPNAD